MSVVGTKIGNKAWSEAPQNEIQRNPTVNTNSAKDLEQLDGQSVGDVLNKVADPNYVDPQKKVRAVGSDKLDKDAFMKLMLAQMKNQDPTNPLKSHEMAAQLAQFSGLEQMQNTNTTLNEMLKGQKPNEGFQALNFIGKAVAGDSSKVTRLKGDKEHEFTFDLPADAKDVDIKIRSSDGDIVRKVSLHNLKAGQNKWVWNGKNEAGATSSVGDYQMMIEAKASNGNKLAVKTDFNGVISGVSYTSDGPLLMVGTQSVKLKDVKKIVDPSLVQPHEKGPVTPIQNLDQKNGQNLEKIKTPDLQMLQGAKDDEDKGAQESPAMASNLATGVGMSSEMIDKLKTETAKASPVAVSKEGMQKPVMKPESKLAPERKSEPTRDERAMASKKAVKKYGA